MARPDEVDGATFTPIVGKRGDTLRVQVIPPVPSLFFGLFVGTRNAEVTRISVRGIEQPIALVPVDGGAELFAGVPTILAPASVPIEAVLRLTGPVTSGILWLVWLDRGASSWLEVARTRQRAQNGG